MDDRLSTGPYMARRKAVQDYHVVPTEESGGHNYASGPDCPCEPRCILTGEDFRLFLHQTHLITVVKTRAPQAREGT